MATYAAAGNRVLVGYRLEAPADVPTAGHPELLTIPTDTPAAAPTIATVSGSPGDIAPGAYAYAFTYVEADGFETDASAWCADGTAASSAASISLSDITVSPSGTVIARRIYRRHTLTGGELVGPYLVGTIYNNTATTYTDALSPTSAYIDLSKVPPTYNQTGVNGGFKFQYVDAADISVNYGVLPSNELTGTVGEAEAYPGQAKFAHTTKQMVRAGYVVPLLSSFVGGVTKKGVASAAEASSGPFDEPTKTYTYDPTTGDTDAYTLSIAHYKGFDAPEHFWEDMPDELTITFEENKPLEIAVKLVGCAHQKAGLATGTVDSYTGTVVCRGIRMDSLKSTKGLKIKIISAPTAGTFTFKCARVDSSYGGSGTLMTGHYNTTSKRQTDYAGQIGDWIELIDETGAFIGGDEDELRRPFSVIFTGDVTALAANDEFVIPIKALNYALGTTPGTPDATSTGFPPVFLTEPRFGPAHVILKHGATSADTRMNFQKGSIKFTRTIDPVNSLGPEAAFPSDLDRPGKIKVQISLTRRLTSREWEGRIEANERRAISLLLQGPRIIVQPGTFSTFRHAVLFTAPHVRVSDVKSAVTNDKVINETIMLEVEQPRDGSSPFALKVTTPEDWAHPSLVAA